MENSVDYQENKGADYYLFLGTDEKIIYKANGILNGIINGTLILTDSRLFFYFVSNISRDKTFIATYPYIVSVELKEGIMSSTISIKNKKESFEIKKINKKEAREYFAILNKIVSENKSR